MSNLPPSRVNMKSFDINYVNCIPRINSSDRPGISAFHKPRESPENSKTEKISATLPKADFITKWLMTADTDRRDSSLNSSFTSVITETPTIKRPPRSPLRQLNDPKRPKFSTDLTSSLRTSHKFLTSPIRKVPKTSKENGVSPRPSERISCVSSPVSHRTIETVSTLSPMSKLAACRAALFGEKGKTQNVSGKSPKKGKNKIRGGTSSRQVGDSSSYGNDRLDPSLEHLISQCDSPPMANIEIDSASSHSESVQIFDDSSSAGSLRKEEIIDSRSSNGNCNEDNVSPELFSGDGTDCSNGNTLEEKISFEDVFSLDSRESMENADDALDRTLVTLIEDPDDPAESNGGIEKASEDSEATFYEKGTPVDRYIIEECTSQDFSPSSSQPIAKFKSNLTISDNSASAEPSQSSRKNDGEVHPVILRVTAKKKRRAKKGSLHERFQALVSAKTSCLRMWRHQMAQGHFKGTCNQCVIMRIRKFTISYGVPYFEGTVIKDSFNLLGKAIANANSSDLLTSTSDESSNKRLTVLTIPEIVGQFTVKEKSALKFYPPFEVIDVDKLIFSVLHFTLIPDETNQSEIEEETPVNEVLHQFDCPCLRAGKLVNSCPEKFKNSKPNIINYFLK